METGSTGSVDAWIRVNGSNYNINGTNLAETYSDRTATWTNNPDTATGWVEADVEGTGSNPLQQFGMRGSGLSAGEVVRCTQNYIRVNYTAAAGGGGTAPSRIFFGTPPPVPE